MSIDPDRLCNCTIGCVLSTTEARRKGVICRYRHGQVKPDSYFVVGGDSTPRRELYVLPHDGIPPTAAVVD